MGKLANQITQAIYDMLWKSGHTDALNYCSICYKIHWEAELKYELNCSDLICKSCYKKYKKCSADELQKIADMYFKKQDLVDIKRKIGD